MMRMPPSQMDKTQAAIHRRYKLFAGLLPDFFWRTIFNIFILCAVVLHHGASASGGHYTALVFHAGRWLHIDDTHVEPIEAFQNDPNNFVAER
jgi:hypothetical protein